jgi:hypothetical protein
MTLLKQVFGRETIAYWEFFNREDASTVIEKNVSMCCTRFSIHRSLNDVIPDRQLHSAFISEES